jgi:hypothetical protein
MNPENIGIPFAIRWRMIITFILGFGWLAFLIMWLFFYAGDFNIYQNIAVFILSIIVLGGAIGGIWMLFGIRKKRGFQDQFRLYSRGKIGEIMSKFHLISGYCFCNML